MLAHGPNEERELYARRSVRAQALIREVNEQIHKLDRLQDSSSELCAIVCECVDSACLQGLRVPWTVYQDVRQTPTRFVVAHGHQSDDFERVVEARDGYVIVDKVGTAAELAIRLDPRRNGAHA